MRFLILALFPITVLANTAVKTPQECLKITDNLDRQYCLDKNIQVQKKQLDDEKKTWSKGLSGDAKAARTEALTTDLEAKKQLIHHIQKEINLSQEQLTALSNVAVTAPAAAPAKKDKKKDKKKGGLRIKL